MKRQIFFDTLVGIVTYYLAFVLRFWDFAFPDEFHLFLLTLPIVIIIKFGAFYYFEIHKGISRYASIEDLLDVIKASSLSTLLIIFVIFSIFTEGYPRSIPVIDGLLTIMSLGGLKLAGRVYGELIVSYKSGPTKRVLVVGAGDAGIMILKEIKTNPKTAYKPIGFIDDDPQKADRMIQGFPVIGKTQDIPKVVYRYKIEEVIIAMPSATGNSIREIVKQCESAKVKFKTLPCLSDIINGTVSISQMKDVDVGDLLRRSPVHLDTELISSTLSEKKILVTGAAGSIGSELCRQIARFNPAELILLDIAETPLFFIERKLKEDFPDCNITCFLLNVRDSSAVRRIIDLSKPAIIYHAAAYKHVPLIENHPLEGIKNNVLGTKIIADAAQAYGVEKFVFVSTDKAVNPLNTMGISKRIGEIYIHSLAQNAKTNFISVRFGNVLDSQGSCIPIFKEQIKARNPITITDSNAKRYFMTIPEAAQLILQASAMGKGGEIFILKMGEQIRIIDLAKDLITLSGLDKDKLGFSFIGLRPGEKLEEELIGKGESAMLTADEKILVVNSTNNVPYNRLNEDISQLEDYTNNQNTKLALEKCKEIINNYS